MLVTLAVRDVVLIERLTLTFAPGLCVLTGETGAGKSILLDALGLALGGRGDSGLVRQGADQAMVTAEFALAPDHPVFAILRDQDMEADGSLVIRRVVNADGRSRCFVNDQPVSVGLLRRLGAELVEVHGQFDTQGLLDPRTHLSVLDAFAGAGAAVAAVRAAHAAWQGSEAARAAAAAALERADAEQAFLRHALAELDTLDPQPDEEASLSDRRTVVQHRERLSQAMAQAASELSGDRGAVRAVMAAIKALARVADKANGRLDAVVVALERAADELADAERALDAAAVDLGDDGEQLDRIEERLFDLRAAARKHGCTPDDLPRLRADIAQRLAIIDDGGDLLQRLARETALAREAYVAAARTLSTLRTAAGERLDRAVAGELAPLRLGRAVFKTAIDGRAEADWGADGIDRVRFLVATNPGAAAGPLDRIASGGELSRFMLALKVVLSRAGTVPTLVFDEVDSGIGGAVADAVGERLARLGGSLQVLVVTHSPQVAARGSQHIEIRKRDAQGRAVTEAAELTAAQRREEIARMLSGASITAEARAAAARLIQHAESSRAVG